MSHPAPSALALLHVPGEFSWTQWTIYPSFLIGWLLFGAAYFLSIGPLRRYFPGSAPVPRGRIASFAAGLAVMFLALQGPLHDLSDYYLFSAHMVQHLILILVMPPLLMAGIPGWLLRPLVKIRPIGLAARFLTSPIVAFLLVNSLFAAWHFPGPYDLMMRNHDVHVAMHLMIMVSGMIMWWPVGSPLPELPRIAEPLQMIYIFVLGIPMMIVAAFITFASTPVYEFYVEAPRITSLSPLDDQKLGGLIMWVPGALVMWIAITWVYFRWSQKEMNEDERRLAGRLAPNRAGMVVVAPPYPKR